MDLEIFTGEHTQKVDGKGRMSIPADFRRVLEAGDPKWSAGRNPECKVIFSDHLQDCLHIYRMDVFAEIASQILGLPRGDPNRARLQRFFLGQSLTVEVDKDGRCIIPKAQRDRIKLGEGEVQFTGMGEYFEVWNANRFEATAGEDTRAWLAEQPAGFDPLILLDESRELADRAHGGGA